ncbi:probable elongation factor 1-delta isoform X2 [Thrips palmi]|uniref:Probable elongation factor 1-delta isoform X2 n=1 Tax=Thrips palmi TaxID=161013 RepID=A0A6P8Z5T4_THRPL|nr:probable elongation factor 1-delta isoform X2 [Thrips palmi]
MPACQEYCPLTTMASPLAHESIWYEKSKYEAAERQYYEKLAKLLTTFKLADHKDLVCSDMSKVVETSTNHVNDSNTNSAVSRDEKRSKKEKKIKKEKKDKELKKEQKNVTFTQDNKQSYVENSGWNSKLKGKPNGVNSEVKGYSSVAVKGTELPFNTVGNNILCQVGNNHIETKNASSNSPMKQSLASEVAKARQHIKQSLECREEMDGIAAMAGSSVELINRINGLEKENASLHKVVADLKNLVISLDGRVKSLEGGKPAAVSAPKVSKKEEEDDDGVDLFGSDSEDEGEEAAKVREARLAAYAEKKSKKPALIAKSNIILSVSPWDDETDMKKMEECVRTIEMDGLLWGASKLVPLAYGIHKLHISCVVEDDKVSIDLLQEKIQDFEDYVQSVDIAAFNKV